MKPKKQILKAGSFLLLLALLLQLFISVILPKNYNGELASPVNTYSGFYKMQDNTVDVLFLGSSHTYSSFIPQVLYDEYGVRGYNLGMGNQSIVLSYFWLKEALKTQSPKAVVLDGIFLFPRVSSEVNQSEASVKKSLNYMHWNLNKLQAIREIAALGDEDESIESFIPTIRFHDRWKELHEEDFSAGEIASRNQLKGFSAAFTGYYGKDDFNPYDSDEAEAAEMLPNMELYLDRIVDLLKEKEIKLILTLTPTIWANAERHQAIAEYAAAHGADFIDYNTLDVWNQIGYDETTDSADRDHPSLWGAVKVTRYMGSMLQMLSGSHEDPQYDATYEYFQQKMTEANLRNDTSVAEYVSHILPERHIVFVTSSNNGGAISEESAEALLSLGLAINLRALEGQMYASVLDGQTKLLETNATAAILETGSVRNGKTIYSIGGSAGDASTISIGGKEYGGSGLRMVVLDRESGDVVASRSF